MGKKAVFRKRRSYREKDFKQSYGQTKLFYNNRSTTSWHKRKRGSFYRDTMGGKHYKKKDYY